MSIPRRSLVLLAALLALAAAVVVVAVARAGGGDDPAFTRGESSYSSENGEGLIEGRLSRPEVVPIEVGEPLTVGFRAPGSRAFDFVAVRLEDDEPARRIRQVTQEDVSVDVADSAVSWTSWVAPQRSIPPRDASKQVGRWTKVGPEGVLVRPGEEVRLRTVLTPGSATGACRRFTLEDGPLWLEREDGTKDRWKRLRYRDTRDGEDHDARSGPTGRASFASGPKERCAGNETGVVSSADGMPDQD